MQQQHSQSAGSSHSQSTVFDADLIQRYDRAGPRYTSYPTALQFHDQFTEANYIAAAQRSNEDPIPSPLSLYVHIPFCATVCFYCGCNKIVTKNRERAQPYLDRLYQEISLHSGLYDPDRHVEQLHWGGGTPTFLSATQMKDLMANLASNFRLLDDDTGEYSIELDPREVHLGTLPLLRELGFNRISLGVQDVDMAVQKAVNRIQPIEMTQKVINQARLLKYHSISLDLIYGLPLQTVKSFDQTLDTVIDMQPDRLAIYNYAHMPSRFKVQRQINVTELPGASQKLDILHHAIDKLTAAGYVYIGMDHFAKPDDELAIAQRNGTLHRNFQGYSTHAECDLIAMGVSSISKVGNTYSQNAKDIGQYMNMIDQGHIPVIQGVELTLDDELRRGIITELMCHFDVDLAVHAERYNVDIDRYFEHELYELKSMQADGLLSVTGTHIKVAPVGRLLIRNIAALFDRYNRVEQEKPQFSRMV